MGWFKCMKQSMLRKQTGLEYGQNIFELNRSNGMLPYIQTKQSQEMALFVKLQTILKHYSAFILVL